MILRKDIENYFRSASGVEFKREVVGIISPHAGYMYSGQIAASAYYLIREKKYDTVIIVGPSHRVAFRGISIFSRGGYETPLGVVPVEEGMAERLKELSAIVNDVPAAHLQEHSVEIQLPFLQIALNKFSFIPLIMGVQDADSCQELARVIYEVSQNKKILIVGSSDLSHFYSYKAAKKMDSIVLDYLKNSDAAGLLEGLESGEVEACGGGPMAVTILVSHMMKADTARLLKYANSGDVTGDMNSVVGYASAVYCR